MTAENAGPRLLEAWNQEAPLGVGLGPGGGLKNTWMGEGDGLEASFLLMITLPTLLVQTHRASLLHCLGRVLSLFEVSPPPWVQWACHHVAQDSVSVLPTSLAIPDTMDQRVSGKQQYPSCCARCKGRLHL